MTSENKSLIDVCYEQIKDNFYYGLFGDFKLVIDKDTGCFNVTKLCNDANKHFYNWKQTDRYKRLIGKHKSYYFRGNKQITGSYLPEKFLNNVIFWMNSINTTVKEGFVYVVTTSHLKSNNIYKIGYTKNLKQRLDTFNNYRHSSEPEYYVVALYSTADARTLEYTIHRKLNVYRDEGEFFKCDIDTIKEAFEPEKCLLELYNYELDTIQQKLEISIEDRAPQPTKKDMRERFILIKRKDETYPYYATIYQDVRATRVLKRQRSLYNKEVYILLDFPCHANSKTLFVRVRDKLKKKGVTFKSRKISLAGSTISEEELINAMNTINDEKRNV